MVQRKKPEPQGPSGAAGGNRNIIQDASPGAVFIRGQYFGGTKTGPYIFTGSPYGNTYSQRNISVPSTNFTGNTSFTFTISESEGMIGASYLLGPSLASPSTTTTFTFSLDVSGLTGGPFDTYYWGRAQAATPFQATGTDGFSGSQQFTLTTAESLYLYGDVRQLAPAAMFQPLKGALDPFKMFPTYSPSLTIKQTITGLDPGITFSRARFSPFGTLFYLPVTPF